MRVTSKGQVTIPIDIRDRFGILPNTEVRFVVRDGLVVLQKAPARGTAKKASRGEAIVTRLRQISRRAARSEMTTEELMALTRGE
jgi:AbrB family looped-hinge helix DNA binding protein